MFDSVGRTGGEEQFEGKGRRTLLADILYQIQ
jgi:hypothetical protein